MTDLHCHHCGRSQPLDQWFALEAERQAVGRLLKLALPVGESISHYLVLHTPAKQRLTMRKVAQLIEQLWPDLQRQAIRHKGIDWPAPHAIWQAAIEQMRKQADEGSIELPLSGHGYLYSVIAGMSGKQAAAAEQQCEQERRQRPATVTVRGQTLSIGEGLQVAYGDKDPALAALDERNRQAAKPTQDVRERIARITGKKP